MDEAIKVLVDDMVAKIWEAGWKARDGEIANLKARNQILRTRADLTLQKVEEAVACKGILDCADPAAGLQVLFATTVPRTVDGQLVLPLSRVFHVFAHDCPGAERIWEVIVIAFSAGGEMGWEDDNWYVRSCEDNTCFGVRPTTCYSTRATAEAAIAENAKNK